MYHIDSKDVSNLVEIRGGISALRDLLAGLAQLAQILAESPTKHGYLVLADPKIGDESIDREVRRFRATLQPEIAAKMHVLSSIAGEIAQDLTAFRPRSENS